MDRVKTGIKGLDELIEGGLVPNSVVLLTGTPGTGKTLFGLEYLYHGAMNGENGLFICIESSPQMLKDQAQRLGMNFASLEGFKKVNFLSVPRDNSKYSMFKIIDDAAKAIDAKRVVFDNLSTFTINLGKFVSLWGADSNVMPPTMTIALGERQTPPPTEKAMAYSIIEQLRMIGATTLVISFGERESLEAGGALSTDKASEFLCDGIIELYNTFIGTQRLRTLTVRKMRNTDHSQHIHNLTVDDEGITVEPAEELYK